VLLAGCAGCATPQPTSAPPIDVLANLPTVVHGAPIEYDRRPWQLALDGEPTAVTGAVRSAGFDPKDMEVAVGWARGGEVMVTAWRAAGMDSDDLRDAVIEQWDFGNVRRWDDKIAGRAVVRAGPIESDPNRDLYLWARDDAVVVVVADDRRDVEAIIGGLPE
jgi:hypothetical protein